MTTSQTSKIEDRSLARDLRSAARMYLGNWRALVIFAVVAIAGGIAFNWSWLVAVGIAPVLLSVLPCLLMCGLGLCANKLVGDGACASQPAQSQSAETAAQSSVSTAASATSGSLLANVSSCCGTAASAQPATDLRQTQSPDERR